MADETNITLCGHGSGVPTTKNMRSYLESRHNSYAKNGKRKGIVAVRRVVGITPNQQMKFHDTYEVLLGRNIYSQNLRQYVFKKYKDGKYYSDCSSSGCASLDAVGLNVSLLNTAGIYQSSKFETVPVEIKNGHIANPDVLQVADALLFAGNDPSRPMQIGHVEWVYDIAPIFTETKCNGKQKIQASNLNIRENPAPNAKIVGSFSNGTEVDIIAKSGYWFKTNKGWISRNYTVGWVNEFATAYGKDTLWYNEKGQYPMSIVKTIDGQDFAFDRDGWCISSDRISSNCSIIY